MGQRKIRDHERPCFREPVGRREALELIDRGMMKVKTIFSDPFTGRVVASGVWYQPVQPGTRSQGSRGAGCRERDDPSIIERLGSIEVKPVESGVVCGVGGQGEVCGAGNIGYYRGVARERMHQFSEMPSRASASKRIDVGWNETKICGTKGRGKCTSEREIEVSVSERPADRWPIVPVSRRSREDNHEHNILLHRGMQRRDMARQPRYRLAARLVTAVVVLAAFLSAATITAARTFPEGRAASGQTGAEARTLGKRESGSGYRKAAIW